ncbi:MAG: DoxX family membrane protein [Acidobacteriota bacterium]|nr:MAG: DoxX family membrane protein [Acidobacteriota bacterium]
MTLTDSDFRKGLSKTQLWALVILRVVIGWHFLYEGIAKLIDPNWSSAGYLQVSRWILGDLFQWIAETPAVLEVVDLLNIWGLVLIGLALLLGAFTRIAAVAGAALLLLYYVGNPPLVGMGLEIPSEGSYLVINKNLVEMVALVVLALFPTGAFAGLDRIWSRRQSEPVPGRDKPTPVHESAIESKPLPVSPFSRRELIMTSATLPFAGAFGYALYKKGQWESYEEKNLVDAMTSASTKALDVASLGELKGPMPRGVIRETEFSRLILGGNLLSGWAHSRDLIYVSQLVKAYHNKEKIFATLLLAERCGVNTLLTNPILCTIIEEYWKRGIGKIQFISDCAGLDYDANGAHPTPYDEYLDRIRRAIDYGATACYIQGETADYYMKEGKADAIEKALQLIRDRGVLVGIGAHHIETIQACVDAGFDPDFWMKTLHHHGYWSARHPEHHDNMYCFNPDQTIEYMESLEQPWIAFKTMAAGAIHPRDAFRFAFEKGADFVCAGMYDFQMVEDCNIALDAFNTNLAAVRRRPWRA